jgi:hypothetical protein
MTIPVPPDPTAITPLPAPGRVIMIEVMRRSFDQSDTFHEDARSFRNRLFITATLIDLVAVSLIILQWRLPSAAIFQLPPDHAGLPRWALTMLIMVFGSVGALVTAIPAMAAIPTVRSPYNFPLPQGLLKIFLGSLTAMVGVVVIGSTGVTTGFASLQALIGVAVVFGAGQQAVTQFLDKRAGQLVAQAGSPQ